MDDFSLGCSVIAAAVYSEGRDPSNRIDNDRFIDALGPQRLSYTSNTTTGFEASAYQYNGQVVIAFAGTGAGLNIDWAANIMLGAGVISDQLLEAAKFYYEVKAKYGDNVVFTGHSLGGGLAALMGVFFDKQAVTFDPAPFRLAATQNNAQALALTLRNAGYAENAALNSYTTQERPLGIAMPELLAISAAIRSPLLLGYSLGASYPDVIARENRVSAYAVKGEALTEGDQGIGADLLNRLRIKSTATPELIDIDVPGMSGLDLHSQALLIAAASAPDLVTVLQQMPVLGVALYDETLYARAPSSTETDFLIKLVQNEYTVGASRTGFITGYVNDMKKLTGSQVQLGEVAKKALIAQAMDWYYAQSAIVSQPFFTQTGSLLQYTTAKGDDLAEAQNKASLYFNIWLPPLLNDAGEFGGIINFKQWNVNAGTGGVTATALDAGKDQLFIGNKGADRFTGGSQADLMLAGHGDDVLNGGLGADSLYGGAGDEGLLVRYLNGDGKIISGQELLALKELDQTPDGRIDTNDAGFQSLRIWKDANQNGITGLAQIPELNRPTSQVFDQMDCANDSMLLQRTIGGTR